MGATGDSGVVGYPCRSRDRRLHPPLTSFASPAAPLTPVEARSSMEWQGLENQVRDARVHDVCSRYLGGYCEETAL